MNDWGFHNCALISHEINSAALVSMLNSHVFSEARKVAVLPCREPVDHFFSQCNYRHVNASSATQSGCSDAIERCKVEWKRFDNETLKSFDYVLLYKFSEIEKVTLFMDDYLPKRIIELESGMKFETNKPRQESREQLSDKCGINELKIELRQAWAYYPSCDILGKDSIKVVKN